MNRTFISFIGFALAMTSGVGTATAAPLAPKKPSQVVVLTHDSAVAPLCSAYGSRFTIQANSDGTQSTFTGVPTGKVFVVTGMSWEALGTAPSSTLVGSLVIENGANFASVLSSPALSDSAGRASASHSLPNGVVVKSGTEVCLAINSGYTTLLGTLQGFLTTDK